MAGAGLTWGAECLQEGRGCLGAAIQPPAGQGQIRNLVGNSESSWIKKKYKTLNKPPKQ
jgi:hypothetical protein